MSPSVSIVIPAYNEALRLPRFLAELTGALVGLSGHTVELLVVDDGSREEEVSAEEEAVARAAQVLRAAGAPHQVRFLRAERNRGKGAAIRLGWAHASPHAAWLGFVDADGAVGAGELCRLVRMLGELRGVDALAGSRIRMAGRTVERSFFRHVQGRLFATLADLQLRLHLYDTQCGAKLFRASLLRPVLAELQEETWLLDLEVLALLGQQGARFLEVPIDWADPGGSKVRVVRDAARMFWGLRRIRQRVEAREGLGARVVPLGTAGPRQDEDAQAHCGRKLGRSR